MLRHVRLIGTGGTIAMSGFPAKPEKTASDLIAATPGLADAADLSVEEFCNVPSVEMDPPAILRLVARAAEAVSDGADGVVIVQGTDALEETSELMDLLWGLEAPVVVTGAMRAAGAAGPDGPRNLSDAVRVAADPQASGLGVVVAFDGVIHSAAEVHKSHTWSTAGFASERSIGDVKEGVVQIWRKPSRRSNGRLTAIDHDALRLQVPIVGAGIGMGSELLTCLLAERVAGMVIAGLGGGHVPAGMLAGIDAAVAADVPVVVCARPCTGGTLTNTYGWPGAERDLAARGAILAGYASPWKARVRLLVALATGSDPRPLFS